MTRMQVWVDDKAVHVSGERLSGKALKEQIGLDPAAILWGQCMIAADSATDSVTLLDDEFEVVEDEQQVTVPPGYKLTTRRPQKGAVTVIINRQRYRFEEREQTGRSLKERAGIPLEDTLFLQRPREDQVIANDAIVKLKSGDRFHSSPPANYGNASITCDEVGAAEFDVLPQPDGWTFLVLPQFVVPEPFSPNTVRLLVKLPPTFPDAAPDMFWVEPPLAVAPNAAPQGTSIESLLGGAWQRFSWHLAPGAWRPGISTLRDFMRCIRSRLEKRN